MNNLFFCSCILGEGLDEGMDILHEMILSNRRRRRQNASNHIGPPKPQRRKVRRSQSTYHWRSTMGSKSFLNCIWIFDRELIVAVLQISFHLSRQKHPITKGLQNLKGDKFTAHREPIIDGPHWGQRFFEVILERLLYPAVNDDQLSCQRRCQNASNHIGSEKPQRRKVRRSLSHHHWQSTVGPNSLYCKVDRQIKRKLGLHLSDLTEPPWCQNKRNFWDPSFEKARQYNPFLQKSLGWLWPFITGPSKFNDGS